MTGTTSFLTDALGSTVALTDGLGTISTAYTYEPFGETTAAGPASDNPYQYAGREDDGTGLYHYRARYYSPSLQRFISEDPIGFAGGDVNLQAYVGNNPLNYVDPSGLAFDPTPGFVDDAVGWGADRAEDAFEWGTDQAQQSMEYYADLANDSDSAFVDAFAYLGGSLSSLATRKNAASTAMTLVPFGLAAKGASGIRWVWKTRQRPGRDGGISQIGIERTAGGDAISQVHRVKVQGRTIHQHQTHIGKHGGQREFPDEWVQFPRIGAP